MCPFGATYCPGPFPSAPSNSSPPQAMAEPDNSALIAEMDALWVFMTLYLIEVELANEFRPKGIPKSYSNRCYWCGSYYYYTNLSRCIYWFMHTMHSACTIRIPHNLRCRGKSILEEEVHRGLHPILYQPLCGAILQSVFNVVVSANYQPICKSTQVCPSLLLLHLLTIIHRCVYYPTE